MPWAEVNPSVADWPSLREVLYRIGESDRLACRGQAADYGRGTLFSTLDRALQQAQVSADLAATVERVSIQRFLQLAPNYLPPQELLQLKDGPGLLMLMRHYRAPTRLVDWTESIWIAAFSAASADWDDDGALWIFDRQQFDAATLARYGDELAQVTRTAEWNGTPIPAVSLYELQPWVSRLVGIGPQIPRIIAQQSMFTIGSRLGLDHAHFIDEMIPDGEPKRIVRIPRELKPKILKELARMGITASSLFPGMDGVGQSLQAFAHYAALDDSVRMVAQGGGGRLQPRP